MTLQTHKRISKRLNDNFGKWHQQWMEENVTEEQISECEDFLVAPNTSVTRITSNNDIQKAPYRPVNRYAVLCRRVSTDNAD